MCLKLTYSYNFQLVCGGIKLYVVIERGVSYIMPILIYIKRGRQNNRSIQSSLNNRPK